MQLQLCTIQNAIKRRSGVVVQPLITCLCGTDVSCLGTHTREHLFWKCEDIINVSVASRFKLVNGKTGWDVDVAVKGVRQSTPLKKIIGTLSAEVNF